MANREAVLKEIADRVFPPLELEWKHHWQKIQTNELSRKNLGWLLHFGLESQSTEVQEKLIQDFYKILFPNRESSCS